MPHAHMSWSQNSTQISTFPLLHTYHMLVCPSPKTTPKPVNFLCSTHAVCSHVLVPKFHPNQYISFFLHMPHACMSWSQNSTQTITFPVLHTCHMLPCPGPKTPPKLYSTHPVLHTCCIVACPGHKTSSKPVHFLCSYMPHTFEIVVYTKIIHITFSHVLNPKLHPNHCIFCSLCMHATCICCYFYDYMYTCTITIVKIINNLIS